MIDRIFAHIYNESRYKNIPTTHKIEAQKKKLPCNMKIIRITPFFFEKYRTYIFLPRKLKTKENSLRQKMINNIDSFFASIIFNWKSFRKNEPFF